ncbi:DUF2069 domain-containing protein [Ralstonia soli]|uniref:DUF2069 domain-containing protein n=1 Tax=Ralstonia soli TaxID=2953896 RepID=A0ABT1AJG9_9RALS|nr:DUF2069 domain-containing protein [Ralstonia soli]MCO5398578.1 DUF2069 domain-containing protein [Ralstonia soli]
MTVPDHPVTESRALFLLSAGSLVALIVLCAAWELWLAPVRPGGSWLAIKALLLAWPLPGVLHRNRYTMQWASMFILLFFTEGIVRATSDAGLSRSLAWCEVVLSVVFFSATILYLRPFKRAAKARASQST